MSLLSICRDVLAETGWPVLNTIASNSDPTAVQIFSLANKELEALSEAYDWPHLETDYSFNTVDGTSIYAWPSDFRKSVSGSLYDASEYYSLRGSLPADEWHLRKYGLLGSIGRQSFRVKYVGGVPGIEIAPEPNEARELVALYQTTNYASTDALVIKEKYELDTDLSLIPERLVKMGLNWRFRRAKGLDFSAEIAEWRSTVQQQFSARIDAPDIMIGSRHTGDNGITGGYVPDNGFG